MKLPAWYLALSKRYFAAAKPVSRPKIRGLVTLPDGFDGDLYLKINSDVREAGLDPVKHYLSHGYQEGRAFSLPEITIWSSNDLKSDQETILIVSHEASRTGAPVLSLNLAQSFVERYNVVILLLDGGPLTEAFKIPGSVVISAFSLRRNPNAVRLALIQVGARFSFKFALINSIESRVVLEELAQQFVPTISLIHEFASYTRPRDAFCEAFFWSVDVVFSANLTKENVFAEYPDLDSRSTYVIPQGRCSLPNTEFTMEHYQRECERIRRLIRPKTADNSVIVLGAGFVQLRKGVDLFVECATRVMSSPGGERCRFVWVGKGYDPENDVAYSVYLEDQIRRAGLQDVVFLLDETIAIEAAYQEADLFLLSSRLDPLPNVALDAMIHGVPLLCFNKTGGIADFLTAAGLSDCCVARYIDTAEMAKKILALINSTVLRDQVADQCRIAASAYFDMKEYIAQLDRLAQIAIKRSQQEQEDTSIILRSGVYQPEFARALCQQDRPVEFQVRAYVRSWASGIKCRKPYPGFHPGIYAEQHGISKEDSDPLAEFLRAGCPEGPWNYPVIITTGLVTSDNLPNNRRVALHVHAYHTDKLREIVLRLLCNKTCPDLFVTVASAHARKRVVEELKAYQGRIIDIQVQADVCSHIDSLLRSFGPLLISNYDFIGHIHTENSVSSPQEVNEFRYLLDNLLGGDSDAVADHILKRMNQDSLIGLVFADDPYVVHSSGNREIGKAHTNRAKLQHLSEYYAFPVGLMFWASAKALRSMINMNPRSVDYSCQFLQHERSAADDLRRLFSLSLSVAGLRSAVTYLRGVTR